MKTPAFWNDRRVSFKARMLLPFGLLYGWLTARRMTRPGVRAALPVICIGNLTAGGAGKTPTALALAGALAKRGLRPAFLTRGYGGSITTATRVDPDRHSATEVGDEALLLARAAPCVVSPDRVAGATLIAAAGDVDVIIMDDGLQNPALTKDFTLAVVDGGAGFGNGLCVPAGPLRAPLKDQIGAVDALLAIGIGRGLSEAMTLAGDHGRPCFRANVTVEDRLADRLAGEKVLAFAGIGRPEKFFETLSGLYARIEGARAFPDHHAYSDADANALMEVAIARGLTLVTTEKDAVKLKGSPALDALRQAVTVVPVRLALSDELVEMIEGRVRQRALSR